MVRVARAFCLCMASPALSDAQVHFMWPNGRGQLLVSLERARPGYGRLLALLQGVPGSQAARTWVDRVNPFSRGVGNLIPSPASLKFTSGSQPAASALAGGFYGGSYDSADAGGAPAGLTQGLPAGEPEGPGGPVATLLMGSEVRSGLDASGRMPSAGEVGEDVQPALRIASSSASASSADAQAAARASTDATRFGEVDIITGQPVRDLKMEPVMALKRWLRRSGSGSFSSGSFDEDARPNSLL